LDDQQLAGMLMLIACPLTYVAAGVVLAGRWLFGVEADHAANA
jgi:putative membrane protein